MCCNPSCFLQYGEESSHSPLGEHNGAMANQKTLLALLICGHIAGAFSAMYEAYTIDPSGFVVNSTLGQMNHFMCSDRAGKSGHSAFRIIYDTCEMGIITANAKIDSNGTRLYVESGSIGNDCVITPTINAQTAYNGNYLAQKTLIDDNNYWLGGDRATDRGIDQYITIDLGCSAKIDQVHLRNTWGAGRYQ